MLRADGAHGRPRGLESDRRGARAAREPGRPPAATASLGGARRPPSAPRTGPRVRHRAGAPGLVRQRDDVPERPAASHQVALRPFRAERRAPTVRSPAERASEARMLWTRRGLFFKTEDG